MVNARQRISNAIGVRFAREMDSVSPVFNVVCKPAFRRVFDFTNRVNTSLTPVRTEADLIVLRGILFLSQPMFRQEFPERNCPIVFQKDGTIKILRVNLGYGLAAPPARCNQNPSFRHSHNGQNVPFSCFQHVGHRGHLGTETQSALQVDANTRVNIALCRQHGSAHGTS